jgi:hypothetical protein
MPGSGALLWSHMELQQLGLNLQGKSPPNCSPQAAALRLRGPTHHHGILLKCRGCLSRSGERAGDPAFVASIQDMCVHTAGPGAHLSGQEGRWHLRSGGASISLLPDRGRVQL